MAKTTVHATIKAKDSASPVVSQHVKNIERETKKANRQFARYARESNQSMAKIKTGINEISTVMKVGLVAAVGAAATQIGGRLIGAINESIDAFRVQEEAVNRLRGTLENMGMEQRTQEILDFAAALQSVTTFGDEATIPAIQAFIDIGATAGQAQRAIVAAADLAAAKGITIEQATRRIVRGVTGSISSLEQFYGEIESSGDALDDLNTIISLTDEKWRGMARAMAETPLGQLDQFNNSLGDLKEIMGQAVVYMPEFQQIAGILNKIATSGEAAAVVASVGVALKTFFFSAESGVLTGLSAFFDKFQTTLPAIAEEINKAQATGVASEEQNTKNKMVLDFYNKLKDKGMENTQVYRDLAGVMAQLTNGVSFQTPDFSEINTKAPNDAIWSNQFEVGNQLITDRRDRLNDLGAAMVQYADLTEQAVGKTEQFNKAQNAGMNSVINGVSGLLGTYAQMAQGNDRMQKQVAAINMVIEAAKAYSAFASGNYWAGANHLLSATLYGKVGGGGGNYASGGGAAVAANFNPVQAPDNASDGGTTVIVSNSFDGAGFNSKVSGATKSVITDDLRTNGAIKQQIMRLVAR